jgi:hypothetical protein
LGIFFLLLFFTNAFFYINYRVIDKNTMFLPAFLIWAFWVGVGYEGLISRLGALLKGKEGSTSQNDWQYEKQVTYIGRGIMVLLVVLALSWNLQRVNLASDDSARARGEAILETAEPNAIVFGWWDTVPVVEYLQLVEGQRPDILAINRFLISGQDMETLIEEELGNRPIYINSPPTHLLSTIDAVPAGPVYKLQPRLMQKEVNN